MLFGRRKFQLLPPFPLLGRTYTTFYGALSVVLMIDLVLGRRLRLVARRMPLLPTSAPRE